MSQLISLSLVDIAKVQYGTMANQTFWTITDNIPGLSDNPGSFGINPMENI